MRKFLLFANGDRFELSPLTYDEFTRYDQWVGWPDTSFEQFKRWNGFRELDDFNEDMLRESKIIFEEGEPGMDWSVVYGELENGGWKV